MTTTIMTPAESDAAGTAACVYSASEAAAKLGRSVASVRRELRALGVTRIAGRTVAAMVHWQVSPVAVRLPVSHVVSAAQ